jgi:hypothetical protein
MRWLLPAGSIGPRRYAINLLGPASDMTKQPDSTLRAPTTGYTDSRARQLLRPWLQPTPP